MSKKRNRKGQSPVPSRDVGSDDLYMGPRRTDWIWRIRLSGDCYAALTAEARFCLAYSPWGYGGRQRRAHNLRPD